MALVLIGATRAHTGPASVLLMKPRCTTAGLLHFRCEPRPRTAFASAGALLKRRGSPSVSQASFDTLSPFRPRGRELLHQAREIGPSTVCAHACSGFLYAFRCSLSRLLLHASDERTQIRRRRHVLTRWARRSRWPRQGHVDLGEAPRLLDVLAAANDAVGKCDARLATGELAHLEVVSALTAHIEPVAI